MTWAGAETNQRRRDDAKRPNIGATERRDWPSAGASRPAERWRAARVRTARCQPGRHSCRTLESGRRLSDRSWSWKRLSAVDRRNAARKSQGTPSAEVAKLQGQLRARSSEHWGAPPSTAAVKRSSEGAPSKREPAQPSTGVAQCRVAESESSREPHQRRAEASERRRDRPSRTRTGRWSAERANARNGRALDKPSVRFAKVDDPGTVRGPDLAGQHRDD